jgi:hypothetical protein
MIRIELTRYQRILAKSIGHARCAAKPDSVRYNDSGYHEDPDRAYPHVVGATAEIAYARVVGASIDTSIMSKGDSYDFPGKVEVKASMFEGDGIELKVKLAEYSRKEPRKYVLVRVSKDLRFAEIIGFITRDHFDEVKEKKNYGYKDNWVVGLDHLSPVEWDKSLQNQVREADNLWMNSGAVWGSPEHKRYRALLKKLRDSEVKRAG